MSKRHPLFAAILTALLAVHPAMSALAQEPRKPAGEAKRAQADFADGAQQYCANIANAAADARLGWQMKRLGELEAQLKQRIAELEAKEAESKEWVDRREAFMKKAEDGVVAIYAKMQPEAAAAQIGVMEEATAAALLSKLNPKASSAILNELEPAKAALLTELMSGFAGPPAERRKS